VGSRRGLRAQCIITVTDDLLPGAYSVTPWPKFLTVWALWHLITVFFFWLLSHFIPSSLVALFLREGSLIFLFPAPDFEHVRQQSRFSGYCMPQALLACDFCTVPTSGWWAKGTLAFPNTVRPDGTPETCLARAYLPNDSILLHHLCISKRKAVGSGLSFTNQRTKNGRNAYTHDPR